MCDLWVVDVFFRLPHVRHHLSCGSDYHIYITGKGDPKQNLLRDRMARLLKLREDN